MKYKNYLGSWSEYQPALSLLNSLKQGLSKGEYFAIDDLKEDSVEVRISTVAD